MLGGEARNTWDAQRPTENPQRMGVHFGAAEEERSDLGDGFTVD